MSRLRRLTPAELTDRQRDLYDAITGGPRAGGTQHFRLVADDGSLEGPFNALLLQPDLGDPLQALGAAIRYRTGLSDRAREIAILIVAAAWDSAFERHAHEAIARSVGLTDAELDAIRAGAAADTTTAWPDPGDHLLVLLTRALVDDGDLDDDLYDRGVTALGEHGLFELTTLVGYYATLARQLRVFRVGLPQPATPPEHPTPPEAPTTKARTT